MCPTSPTHGLWASAVCHPSPKITLKTSILNVSRGGGCTGWITVVDMDPVNIDTTVAVPGSLWDDVEAPDDTENSTVATVARETTM